jgi:uncharacterized glyoxalase superfamily protein PhnB
MASRKKKAARPAKARRPAKKVAKKVQPVPAAYGSLTPGLVFKDARPAIEWYARAFGGKVATRLDMPDGKVMHAEMKIGDSVFMMGDEAPQMEIKSAETLGGSGAALMLYVKDCDAVFAKAVAEGARALMPIADMFWGDRYGQVVDPFGHRWGIATHKVDMTPKQMQKAAAEAMAKMAAQGGAPAGG